MTRAGRKTKLAVVAAVAAMALTGCGVLHPGDAAVVGSRTISDQQVDDVALALCSANSGGASGGQQAAASRGARLGALQVLLDSEISRQLGAKDGVSPDKHLVSQALSQNAQSLKQLPVSQQAAFKDALQGYAEGQTILIAVGKKALEAQGQTNITQKQAIAAGSKLRNKYTNSIDVKIDPRYGTFSKNSLTPGGDTLSVAVSAHAADGASPDPSAGWVASLPASQKCS